MLASDLETPALLVDLDIMEENIRRVQERMRSIGLHLRPHIKAHKTPAIAHKQLAAGAIGIACQKLGEAEVMSAAGINGDILIHYPIIGGQKLDRLMRLAKQANVTVAVDSVECIEGISEAAHNEGCQIHTLVELMVGARRGGKRTGVETPEEVLKLAQEIVTLPGLSFRGLTTTAVSPAVSVFIVVALDLLEEAKIPVSVVSGSGTDEIPIADQIQGLTEFRPGTYVFNDIGRVRAGVATLDQCALMGIVTVVSRPEPGVAITDGGYQTFARGGTPPFGHVKEYPEAKLYQLDAEHGFLDVSACSPRPCIGDRLTTIVLHVSSAVGWNDQLIGVRGAKVEAIWDIQARGKTK